jgi:predicted Zn-dependent protease
MAKLFFILSAFILAVQGCATVPYTERKQIMMVSESEEAELGAAIFKEVKQGSKVSSDARMQAMVSEVGRRIAAAADRPEYKWEFTVIEDKSVNAFALPGGKVAFHTGIMPVCQDESGIAAVMGHEVAHVLARHGSERMSQQQALSVGGAALMAAFSGSAPLVREGVLQAYGLGAQVGVMLPYSRSHELEADKIGMILMAKAGYDPRQSVSFWERMLAKKNGSSTPQFLSTHPNDQKRVEELKSFLPVALTYYNGK